MAKIEGVRKLQAEFKNLIAEAKAKKNAKPSVIVGYTAAYAVYVHENIEMKGKGQPRPKKKGGGSGGSYWDPQGRAQSKFLETPARTLQPELAKIIRDVTRSTGSLQEALEVAGLRLQRESQRLVPVDSGNLKASAFMRPG